MILRLNSRNLAPGCWDCFVHKYAPRIFVVELVYICIIFIRFLCGKEFAPQFVGKNLAIGGETDIYSKVMMAERL